MEVLPTVAALRAHADDIVDQVLAENAGKWESASARDLTRVEAIARASVNRLLHEPTIRLRAMGAGSSHGRLALLRELFGLERGDDESDEASGNVRSLGR
jgi:glutamyl-tRNA reductase